MDFTWLGIQILYVPAGNRNLFKKGRGVDQTTSGYLVWPPCASCSATHLLHIELIRLLIVACGMLYHSSSMAVWSCWNTGTGTCCRTRRSRASKHAQWVRCLVSVQAMEELGHFQLPGIVYRDPCDMGTCIIMLKYEVMAADEWHENEPQDLVTVSLCTQIANRSPTRSHTHADKTAIFLSPTQGASG